MQRLVEKILPIKRGVEIVCQLLPSSQLLCFISQFEFSKNGETLLKETRLTLKKHNPFSSSFFFLKTDSRTVVAEFQVPFIMCNQINGMEERV